jgi:hypothetical protein
VITPGTAVWLAGYGSQRAPEGKLHELWMKALALEDAEGCRAVLVTSDFQGIPRSFSDNVIAQALQRYGLERRQLMLTFSHNHCGPRLGDDLLDYYPIDAEQERLVAEYSQQMAERMTSLIGEALGNLSPALLARGEGSTTFAVNRRNNREADVPELLANGMPLRGPVDHAVPVLQVNRPDGAPAAVLFGYACHPTTLSFRQWCGDYPGFAQLDLERQFPGAQAMFVNTCGGDQNPLPRRTVELCERYGRELAEGVQRVLAGEMTPVRAELRTAFEFVELPYLKTVDENDLQRATASTNAIERRWGERLLRQSQAGAQFPGSYPYPVHAWGVGQLLLIGQGAETVVDYALRYKAEYGPGCWALGYVDDMIAYIPSRRVWEEGGYEGGANLFEYGRPAYRWSGEVEERIAGTVERLVREVRK